MQTYKEVIKFYTVYLAYDVINIELITRNVICQVSFLTFNISEQKHDIKKINNGYYNWNFLIHKAKI